jgi:hypothetical protein
MKAWWTLAVVTSLVLAGGFLWFKWKQDERRKNCIQALQQLVTALQIEGCSEVQIGPLLKNAVF